MSSSGDQPKSIRIVIVTFNNFDLITQCLTSLAASVAEFDSYIYIIDNNSTDGTRDILNNQNPALFTSTNIVFNTYNAGFTRGINQGLYGFSQDYLLILNPDVILYKNTINDLVKNLTDPGVGVVAPQLRFPDLTIQMSCRRFPRKKDVFFELTGLARLFHTNVFFNRWKMPDFDHRISQNVEQPQGAFLLTRYDVLKNTGFLDERFPMFFSDVDWCKRVINADYKIFFNADTFVIHYKGASVYKHRAKMIVSSHRSFVDYFTKYDVTPADRFTTLVLHVLLLLVLLPRILAVYLFSQN